MLNELALLKNGIIDAVGEQVLERTHKSIDVPGKSNLIRTILDKHAKIIELDILEGEKSKNYWTCRDGNKNSFPAIKIPFPFRPGGVEEFSKWKKDNKNTSPKELAKYLEILRNAHPVNLAQHKAWPDYRQKLVEREKIYSHLQGDSSIIHKLIKTYLFIDENGLSLLRDFDEKLWTEWQNKKDKKMLELMALAMFGGGHQLTKSRMIPDEKRILLLLDIENIDTPSAAHRHWKPVLSKILFEQDKEKLDKKIDTCAISGLPDVELVSDTFPKPKCEILGNVIIFSRKKGVYTYERYGKLGATSYPLSTELADDLASALEYVNEKEQGTTWDKLPAENGGDDLLIVFCREFPKTETARLVAYHQGGLDEFFDEHDYEEECKQICKSFKGENIELDPRADFLILRKINDGVKKVIFSSSQPVNRIKQASTNWNRDCKNTPPIKLALFKKGDKKPIYCSPKPISPTEFALLFRNNYTRSLDKKPNTVPGSAFADIMALFLNDARASELARMLLPKLLKQFSNLLEQVALGKTKPNQHFESLRAITAISLLLAKLGRKKEDYMKELAYKLGQFCAVLDEIHIGYCVSVRKGQIPDRLIGNQAYTAAVVNPQKALEITAQRFAVYEAWAQKNSLKESEKLNKKEENAKYAYFWLRKNSAEIHQLLPDKIPVSTPESKAELLLGYLAGRPITKKQNVPNPKTTG